MNNPNSIMWVLGPNGLPFLLEQERKHWLLKTDKNKQTQDDVTGDIFQGKVDNRGSNIVVETEKTPYKTSVLSDVVFANSGVRKILSPAYSAFTYTSSMNGLLFARIESMSYPVTDGAGTVHNRSYKLEFTNAEEIIIPFAASNSSSEVYATKWIKTTTVPKLILIDDDTNTKPPVGLSTAAENVTYYYPMTSNMQLLKLHRTGNGVYTTDAVTSDVFIGYPLFWFTCSITDIGPTTSMSNITSPEGKTLAYIGNEGNASKYKTQVYVGIDGDMDATPDDTVTSEWALRVHSATGTTFNDTDADYNMALNPASIEFVNITSGVTNAITFDMTDVDKITLSSSVEWTYVDNNTYSISLSEFDVNCMGVSSGALTPALTIHFKESIPFTSSITSDIGYAGIEMTSALESDQSSYPYMLNTWDGLPEWLNESEGTPQHTVLYAIHNTPFYSEEIPDSRQVAALILDPGKQVVESDNTELENDERGRIYVLSNDDTTYENNAKAEHPKPARTVARICDIPTTVTQFMNVSGLVPVSVVDKEYVHSEVSFTEADINRLYNTLGNRIVFPTMITTDAKKLYDPLLPVQEYDQDNEYIFNGEEMLKKINLMSPANELREYINLNPIVMPSHVTVNRITDQGSGYEVDDVGMIIVGGAGLDYIVTSVNSTGGVTGVSIAGQEENIGIHLSNFKIDDDNNGYTSEFGSSASSGEGHGLKVQFYIDNYSAIKTQFGRLKDNLVAFVKNADGLYMYAYVKNNGLEESDEGEWVKKHLISSFNISTTDKSKGGTSATDAYLNTTIPSFKPVAVKTFSNNTQLLKTISTATMINIIDKDCTPFAQTVNNEVGTPVDICGWSATPMKQGKASPNKDYTGVMNYINDHKLGEFDSYLVWRWLSDDTINRQFEYCFIRRTVNNYLNTDVTTLIPENKLVNNTFVNSNANTTIVWDVPNFGVMMWIYSPNYDKHEKYHIDPETHELYISYTNEETTSKMSWSDFKLTSVSGEEVPLVDENKGTFNFNIMSNTIYDGQSKSGSLLDIGIYAQPDFIRMGSKNTAGSAITSIDRPHGNWRLVFPHVNMFSIKSEETGVSHPEMKLRLLQTMKSSDVVFNSSNAAVNVLDSDGNRVNGKCVIFNETGSGTDMMIYNTELDQWVKL